MKYIVSGPALDKVIRENRIRVARGEIKFTPFVEAAPAPVNDVTEAPVEDAKDVVVEDTKDVPVVDTKKPVKKDKK